jgi:hypothetical protein
MDEVMLRPEEILSAFDGPVPGVYFRLSVEVQARIFTALARFLVEHPWLPPLSMPSCGVHHPQDDAESGMPYAEAQVSTVDVPHAVAVAAWAVAAGVDVQAQDRGSGVRLSARIELSDAVELTVWAVERVPLRPSPRQALDELLRARLGAAAGCDPAGGGR